MKAKEKEVLKTHTAAELGAEVAKLREKLFRLKFKHGVSPLTNPMELRNLRRHAARLETWISQKQENGGATAAPAPKPAKAKAAKAAETAPKAKKTAEKKTAKAR